jgi:hypothetical protein
MLSSALQWIRLHWEDVLAVSGVLAIVLLSIKNRYGDKAPKWLDVALDVLSLLPRKGQVGPLGPVSLPGLPSMGGKKREGDEDVPPAPPSAVLAIVFAGLALSGCKLAPEVRADLSMAMMAEFGRTATQAITAHDDKLQADLVVSARLDRDTKEERAKLAEWVPNLSKARAAVQIFYAALLVEQTALFQFVAGKLQIDVPKLLAGLAKIASQLLDALTKLGIENLPRLPDFGELLPLPSRPLVAIAEVN